MTRNMREIAKNVTHHFAPFCTRLHPNAPKHRRFRDQELANPVFEFRHSNFSLAGYLESPRVFLLCALGRFYGWGVLLKRYLALLAGALCLASCGDFALAADTCAL